MRSSIDFGRLSAPISAWAFRPRFSFVSGLLVSASSVSSAFLPSSVDASTVAAYPLIELFLRGGFGLGRSDRKWTSL